MKITIEKRMNVILGGLNADRLSLENDLEQNIRINLNSLTKPKIDKFTKELQDILEIAFSEKIDLLIISNA